MIRLILSTVVFFTVLTISSAQKFGFVNSQELLQLMPEFKTANSDLDVLKSMFEKKGKEMVQTLQAKYQDLQKKEQSGQMAPIELQKQGEALKAEEAQLGEFEKTSQAKIYAKTEELLKPLQDKFNKAIKDVATENGFAYIFDSGAGLILYADTSTDCATLIKTKLGIAQ